MHMFILSDDEPDEPDESEEDAEVAVMSYISESEEAEVSVMSDISTGIMLQSMGWSLLLFDFHIVCNEHSCI